MALDVGAPAYRCMCKNWIIASLGLQELMDFLKTHFCSCVRIFSVNVKPQGSKLENIASVKTFQGVGEKSGSFSPNITIMLVILLCQRKSKEWNCYCPEKPAITNLYALKEALRGTGEHPEKSN